MATISAEAQEVLESKGWTPQESRALLKGITTQQESTKDDIHELSTKIGDTKVEIKQEITNTKAELKEDIHSLDRKIETTANALDKKIDSVKTELEKKIIETKTELGTELKVIRAELKYVKWMGAAIVVGVFLPWIRALWMP